jgi:hypothetical protein
MGDQHSIRNLRDIHDANAFLAGLLSVQGTTLPAMIANSEITKPGSLTVDFWRPPTEPLFR